MSNRFSFCTTEREVLERMAYATGMVDPAEMVAHAEQRLEEIRALEDAAHFITETVKHLGETDARIADDPDGGQGLNAMAPVADESPKKPEAPTERPPTKAAVIEFIEHNGPTREQNPHGVVKPNEILINGTPVLIPADSGLEIENLEYDPNQIGETGLIVKVRMFARQILIGEPR